MSHHDHDHDHDHELENTIFLVDDTGEEVEFEIIITLEHEGKEYALLRKPSDEDSDEMYAFRIEEDEEGEILMPVEDDAEIELIQKAYDELSWEE